MCFSACVCVLLSVCLWFHSHYVLLWIKRIISYSWLRRLPLWYTPQCQHKWQRRSLNVSHAHRHTHPEFWGIRLNAVAWARWHGLLASLVCGLGWVGRCWLGWHHQTWHTVLHSLLYCLRCAFIHVHRLPCNNCELLTWWFKLFGKFSQRELEQTMVTRKRFQIFFKLHKRCFLNKFKKAILSNFNLEGKFLSVCLCLMSPN